MERLRKRAKELKIPRYSVMKRDDLVQAIEKAEKEEYYKASVTCQACLREQRKQRVIDEHIYNKKTLANTIRDLWCKYCDGCEIVYDGDEQICRKCGSVFEFDQERDYLGHQVKHR